MCIGNGLNSTQYFDMNNCIIFNENVILPVLASMLKPDINISDLKLRNFITTFKHWLKCVLIIEWTNGFFRTVITVMKIV